MGLCLLRPWEKRPCMPTRFVLYIIACTLLSFFTLRRVRVPPDACPSMRILLFDFWPGGFQIAAKLGSGDVVGIVFVCESHEVLNPQCVDVPIHY